MPKAKAAASPTISGVKGFDANLQCRGYQFASGQTYTHQGEVRACEGGFHVITGHPLAVFDYYPPAGSRYCRVEISGRTHTDDNVKTAAEILAVGTELGITDLVNEAISWVTARATPEGETATGSQGAASATGDRGAASATGDRGAASATGSQGAASATGDRGAASATGYQGAASATGDQGAASATGYQGAASATGDRGAASATGSQGAASATGDRGAAMSPGKDGRVMGADGAVLFAVERGAWDGRGYPAITTASGIVGQDGIKAGVWYACVGGKLAKTGGAL